MYRKPSESQKYQIGADPASKWRPDDWNPEHFSLDKRDIEAFETGADAMLEALIKDGKRVNISNCVRFYEGGKPFTLFHTQDTPSKGYLVFIPD